MSTVTDFVHFTIDDLNWENQELRSRIKKLSNIIAKDLVIALEQGDMTPYDLDHETKEKLLAFLRRGV